jgi:hypothetical protein
MCDSCFLTILGWFVAVIGGGVVAAYAERLRVLKGLQSRVMLIQEDIERAFDREGRDPLAEGSLERVWGDALGEIRQAVFLALPYLILCGEKFRLTDAWREVRDFDMLPFYEARSTDELVARVIYGEATETKKQALLRALSTLERRIG